MDAATEFIVRDSEKLLEVQGTADRVKFLVSDSVINEVGAYRENQIPSAESAAACRSELLLFWGSLISAWSDFPIGDADSDPIHTFKAATVVLQAGYQEPTTTPWDLTEAKTLRADGRWQAVEALVPQQDRCDLDR